MESDEIKLVEAMLKSRFWRWWKEILTMRQKRAIALAGKASSQVEQSTLLGSLMELTSLLNLPEQLVGQLRENRDVSNESTIDPSAPFSGGFVEPKVL